MSPRNRIRAVVFDMDGLLLDTEPIYKVAWQRAAEESGQRIDDRLYFRLIGRSTAESERVLHGIFGEGFPMAAFKRRWLRHWRAEVERRGILPKPGARETLRAVERLGLAKVVATSTGAGDARFTLERGGLDGRFDAVVTGDRVERGKPAPDIFLVAAGEAGVEPGACLALEDSDAGVLAASAAGMLTVMVPDMKPPSPEARERADRILGSLEEAPALIALLS